MSKYVVTGDYQLREIAGQILLFPIKEKADELQGTIVLNEISAFVFQQFSDPKEIEEIVSAIDEIYDTKDIDVRSLIVPLVQQFEKYKVVREEV